MIQSGFKPGSSECWSNPDQISYNISPLQIEYLFQHTRAHTHTHTHTDRLTGVSFILPDQYYKIGTIPAGVTLLFHSTLSTQYNTTIYGSVHYDWDFGDGNSLSKTSDSVVSHTYTQSASLQLTLTVYGFSSTVRNITTLHVYQRESGWSLIPLFLYAYT